MRKMGVKKPKVGFKKLTTKLRAKGAKHPKALAAWIGMKKYGKKGMEKRAARGMKKAAHRGRK